MTPPQTTMMLVAGLTLLLAFGALMRSVRLILRQVGGDLRWLRLAMLLYGLHVACVTTALMLGM